MVYLYYCSACENGQHKYCEIGHSAPPGVCGGSKCRCQCNGDPLWNVNTLDLNIKKETHYKILSDDT